MRCEDFPACGHELGDCDGSLYGSDESIKAQVENQWRTGHGMCDHEDGIYNCDVAEDDDEMDLDEEPDGDSNDDYMMEDQFIDGHWEDA